MVSRFVVLAIATISVLYQADLGLSDDLPWVLRTEWTCEQGKQDPTEEYFKTKDALLQEIEKTRKEYAKDGILQFAPCKPVKFLYWYESGPSTGRIPEDAETIEATPEITIGPKPGKGANKRKAGPGGTKRWVMWLEQLKDGQWSQVAGREFEYLESDGITEGEFKKKLEAYIKAVESENKKLDRQDLQRQRRSQAVKPVRYRVKWNETGTDQKPDTDGSLAGTSWKVLSGEKKWRVRSFHADGTWSDTYDGVQERDNSGRWQQDGDTVTLRKSGKELVGQLENGRLVFKALFAQPSNGAEQLPRTDWTVYEQVKK